MQTTALALSSDSAVLDPSLARVLDALPDGIILLDAGWRIIYANPAARSISRLEDHHINGPTHWELYPETIGTPIEQIYREAMQTQLPRQLEAVHYAPFDVWLDVRVLPTGSGIALFYRDITEQYHVETERRELQQRIHLALEAANGVGTWDWNVPADRVYADGRFAHVYGLDPRSAANGVPLADCTRNIHPEDFASTTNAINASLERALPFAHEYRLLQSDGSARWVIAHGRCTHDAAGQPLRFSGVTVDITERKRTEAALIQSEKLAAVGRMASSIAHEINNPLESVTNLLYIARQYVTLPEVQNFLDLADQELRRVSLIANQTLRFHKQSTLPREISCVDLFSTVLSLYEGRLRNSGIRVEKRKRADRPIACFEGDIRQVLNNLVSNAIDAMSTQAGTLGGRLLLRSCVTTDWRTGRSGLALTVADTGPGISPQARARIFEPFFTTKGMSGTGLGLWISTEIVARHQGRLLIRSSQNPSHHGTVCSLFLPFTLTHPTVTPRPN